MKRVIVITVSMMFLSLNAFAQGEFANPEGNPGYSPAATAMPDQSARGTTTVGFLLGPKFGVVNATGTIFTLGAEIATNHFQMPLILGFGGGNDLNLELIPKYKYDIEVIPNLLVTPSVGLALGFGFGDFSAMTVGAEIAARGTYFITPQIGVFFEPLALNMNFLMVVFDADTLSDFWMNYRMTAGAVYAF